MNKKLILTIGTITSAIAPVVAVVACGNTSTSNDGKTQGTGNSNNSQTSSDGYFDDGLYRSKRPMKDYPEHFKILKTTAYKMWNNANSEFSLEYFDKYNGKVDFSTSPWTHSSAYEAVEYGTMDKNQNRKHFVVNRYEVYDYGVSHGWNYHYLTK